jgi:hypothetical protein
VVMCMERRGPDVETEGKHGVEQPEQPAHTVQEAGTTSARDPQSSHGHDDVAGRHEAGSGGTYLLCPSCPGSAACHADNCSMSCDHRATSRTNHL